MEKQQPTATSSDTVENQLETLETPQQAETETKAESIPEPEMNRAEKQEKHAPEGDYRVFGVGEWMITILFFLLPIINIIMMAIWAFSSKGNINRRNISRAGLLWMIILLLAYAVAMTVAGYTILDIFPGRS